MLTKHNQGTTPIDLLKHRKTVCVAIKPGFVSNSVICIMSQNEIDTHDIAMECQQWQLALTSFAKWVARFDMLAPFQMPSTFDSSFFDHPDKVLKTTSFINILDNWRNLTPDTVYLWQGWLNVYASAADTISMEWCEEILDLSLDGDLKGKVEDTLREVDTNNKGAVTTYFLVTQCLVVQNQEATDAMLDYLKNFSILNYAGQNVSIACRRIMAIARALQDDLPPNTVSLILDGFAQASTPKFKQTCANFTAMLDISDFEWDMRKQGTYLHLLKVLKDLERKFTGLSTKRAWLGVGHKASSFTAGLSPEPTLALPNNTTNPAEQFVQTYLSTFSSFHASEVYAAWFDRSLSYDEWVKDKTCHHCGEKGHIKRICPKLKCEHGILSNVHNSQQWYNGHPPDRRPQRSRDNFTNNSRPPRKNFDTRKSNDHDRHRNKWAERVLNAIKDIDSDSNESADSNTTNSDDEHGDNNFHANVASALSESNW